ncbi:hypothetical protein ACFW04_014739 [Cataglyphis niger]
MLSNGTIVIRSEDEIALNWLSERIGHIFPWEHANLRVMCLDALQKRYRAAVDVPGTAAAFLGLLERQNPGISTASWHFCQFPTEPNPRATIAVNGLEAQLMSLLCSRDIAAIVMDFRRFNTGKIKKIVVSSASFPHEKENSLLPELVINLMKYCQNERPPLIVWCNASHDLRKHQLQRLGLLKYLVATNLEILNRSYEPIFQNMLTCEILDLTICSKNLVSEVVGGRGTGGEVKLRVDHLQRALVSFEKNSRNMSRPLDWDLFRRTQKTYRDSVVTAKRESWKKFCESIEEILEASKLCRILGRNRYSNLQAIRFPDGD